MNDEDRPATPSEKEKEKVWQHIRTGKDPNKPLGYCRCEMYPLNVAVQNDMADAVVLLLQMGASPNVGGGGDLPLIDAIKRGNDAIVGLLLLFGADPMPIHCNGDCTPLHIAAIYNQTTAAALLIAHGAINGLGGFTPLRNAACSGHIEIAQLLIDTGTIPRIVNNALHDASRHNQNSFVRWLISTKADVNVNMNYYGSTPLSNAAKNNNIDMARVLLNHGANVNAVASKEKTALDYAGTLEMKTLLKEAGGKTFAEI